MISDGWPKTGLFQKILVHVENRALILFVRPFRVGVVPKQQTKIGVALAVICVVGISNRSLSKSLCAGIAQDPDARWFWSARERSGIKKKAFVRACQQLISRGGNGIEITR